MKNFLILTRMTYTVSRRLRHVVFLRYTRINPFILKLFMFPRGTMKDFVISSIAERKGFRCNDGNFHFYNAITAVVPKSKMELSSKNSNIDFLRYCIYIYDE